MSDTLLTTKLYIHPWRSEWVVRPRLLKRLDEGWSCGLTLVSAPAGSGKTTLLSEWVNQEGVNACWISLDAADNNPVHLLSYIAAAIQTIEPTAVHETLSTLQSRGPLSIEPVLVSLLNELSQISARFALVLDDYHIIENQAVHDLLLYLVDHAPPQMHLVIATRVNPPLPLARLRGSGRMIELREQDLRFTHEEAAAFLNRALGVQFSAKDIRALHTRTEGWIVGLQLAALSLRDHENVSEFISAFTGSHRYVLDYLTEEVLDRQLPETQQFLLQTSILSQLRGTLCDAVTGQGSGQATLEALERANLFIVPLDIERRWYRYHHLFGDMLQRTLGRTQRALIPELHRRASAWYEQQDSISEAISHSMAAQDWDQAAALIDRTMTAMLGRGEFFTTMLDRVESLPEEIVRAYPRIAISQAWLLQITMQLDAVEPRLREVERLAGDNLPEELRLQIAVIRASLARHQRDTAKSMALSNHVLEALPDPADENHLQREARIGVAFNLGYTHLWLKADATAAMPWFSQALAISTSVQSLTLTLAALSGLAQALREQGQLRSAEETLRQGLRLVDEAGQPDAPTPPAAAYIHLGIGELLVERNRLEQAGYHLVQGIDLCRRRHIGETLCDGYIYQARLKNAEGDFAGAIEVLQAADELPEACRTVPRAGGPIAACRARLTLAHAFEVGDPSAHTLIEDVERWAQGRDLSQEGEIATLDAVIEHLVWARLLIVRMEPLRALRLLDRLLHLTEKGGLTVRLIEILALKALAHRALDQKAQAFVSLERALSLAEPEGYVRLFVDEGPAMMDLLRQAAVQGIRTGYVGRLLAADRQTAKSASPATLASVEPLSERELEVLRLIAMGMSNPEIADELVIATGTVKSHTGNIYSKLGVGNRTAAVAKARALNLL